MTCTNKMVLPFKWREFGSWYSRNCTGTSGSGVGRLAISDLYFSAIHHNLTGIKIDVDLELLQSAPHEILLCGFLADLQHLRLFEPFIGNPDGRFECYHACRLLTPRPGVSETFELFIPEAGWVLPSIWRFLVQSLGLHRKGHEQMPDIVIFAFEPGGVKPLLFANRSFDYYGSAQRLKEELMLDDFFRLLDLDQNASELEIQRAYIQNCRDLKPGTTDGMSAEEARKQQGRFNRIKQGYQIWNEKLQKGEAA